MKNEDVSTWLIGPRSERVFVWAHVCERQAERKPTGGQRGNFWWMAVECAGMPMAVEGKRHGWDPSFPSINTLSNQADKSLTSKGIQSADVHQISVWWPGNTASLHWSNNNKLQRERCQSSHLPIFCSTSFTGSLLPVPWNLLTNDKTVDGEKRLNLTHYSSFQTLPVEFHKSLSTLFWVFLLRLKKIIRFNNRRFWRHLTGDLWTAGRAGSDRFNLDLLISSWEKLFLMTFDLAAPRLSHL